MSQDQPPSPEPVRPEPSETTPEPSLEAPLDELAASTEACLPAASPSAASVESAQTEMGVASTPMEATPPSLEAVSARSLSTRKPSPENEEILPQTLVRLLGEAVVAAQPVLKKQSIKALRSTIHLLEKAIEQLEAEPTPRQLRRRAPASEAAFENALPPSSQPRTGKLAPTPSTGSLGEKFRALRQQVWRSWRPLLRKIRAFLPTAINRNFSDRALTGAIAGILIIVLWTVSSLLPEKPQPTAIAKAPPAETVAPSPTATPIPSLTPIPAPTPIPPLVKAPSVPKPVEISPAPSKPTLPPPPLKLTPEQKLIARIQDQVAAISNQYASGLVQSVQANFRGSRLIVNMGNGWYGLSRSQQDKLAGEILRRTQSLDFIKLEMVDGTGQLLARSPVVGAEMIILKRSNESTEAA